MNKLVIGFIGAGNIAKAIIEGILKSNTCKPSQIYISHPSASKEKKFGYLGIENETDRNDLVIKSCDLIILCVKPQVLEYVCEKFRCEINPKQLFLSVCAGIKLFKLEEILGQSLKIVRCTLNTAALVGSSCSVFSHNGNLSDLDKEIIECLLKSVGPCFGEIKDSEMDAAMAISACGIAYMYIMNDAMSDGGVKMGLSRELACKLAMQTMKGASELMQKEYGKKHSIQLKDEVCSPGGTTIQGIHELEKLGFRNSVISAVEAAAIRAKQF